MVALIFTLFSASLFMILTLDSNTWSTPSLLVSGSCSTPFPRRRSRRMLAAARKAAAIREFALLRAAALTSVGDVEPEKVERKIVAEVAVACRVSPFQGRRRLHLARDLHLGLDHVRELFAAGELAEDKVLKVVAATAHLDPAERAAVDERLAVGVDRAARGAAGARPHHPPGHGDRPRESRGQGPCRAGRAARAGAAGRRRDGRPGRAPARRTGRRLLRGAAPGGERPLRHRRDGHPQPRRRSSPTPSSNDSPDRPPPATSPSRSRS